MITLAVKSFTMTSLSGKQLLASSIVTSAVPKICKCSPLTPTSGVPDHGLSVASGGLTQSHTALSLNQCQLKM